MGFRSHSLLCFKYYQFSVDISFYVILPSCFIPTMTSYAATNNKSLGRKLTIINDDGDAVEKSHPHLLGTHSYIAQAARLDINANRDG